MTARKSQRQRSRDSPTATNFHTPQTADTLLFGQIPNKPLINDDGAPSTAAAAVSASKKPQSQRERGSSRAREKISNSRITGKSAYEAQSSKSKKLIPKVATASSTSTSTSSPTSTTITTTTTPPPNIFGNFAQNNPFNIFSRDFWNFGQTTTTTSPPQVISKRPPKKYIRTPPVATSKDDKNLSYQKIKAPNIKPTVATTTKTPKKDNSDVPFRIALPTLQFTNPQSQKIDPEKEKEKRATLESLRSRFNCPRESEVRFQLFPKICNNDKDCSVWNRQELCCDIFGSKSCVSGMQKPLEESSHAPILGIIPRKCPTRPLAELWWSVQECQTDMDCWPRVCCPDGQKRYCRTSQPELEIAPVPVKRSFNYLSEYLECTPPPPPIFDLHPKACTSTLDCFPNVCCQEAGLRHCRPPKKSVLTLMANFLNVGFVQRLAQNIVIK
ncbi:uncharacterized protein LOC119681357 [Teleopsis dalmanni]|uniref:uncharacterized protein LOC119681357 n=1 Tax=Teleopsis dalmanni TaxID=139649 RepID=UPI0018CD129D|nr:uncharacterized protein LOC119681357 [Teleopsis dalmanni]